jgi:hypothetical protein
MCSTAVRRLRARAAAAAGRLWCCTLPQGRDLRCLGLPGSRVALPSSPCMFSEAWHQRTSISPYPFLPLHISESDTMRVRSNLCVCRNMFHPPASRCAGNAYNTPAYAVGVARATAIGGPYTKDAGNPILHSASASPAGLTFYGPGHCSVVLSQAGNWSMVYHAWCVSRRWEAVGSGQGARAGYESFKWGQSRRRDWES